MESRHSCLRPKRLRRDGGAGKNACFPWAALGEVAYLGGKTFNKSMRVGDRKLDKKRPGRHRDVRVLPSLCTRHKDCDRNN